MLLRSLAVLALLPALAAGQDRTSTDLFTWSGRVASGATLSIKHFNGPIEVREGSGDRVEVRADRRSRRSEDVTFEVENGTSGVTICAVYRGRNICDNDRRGWNWGGDNNGPPSTRLTVMLPKGVRLEASTGNGAITVDRASNDVELHTGNGDVRLSMTAGNVEVTSGNGELEIEGATGPVRASTGNGKVFVTTSSGPVNVRTGNGAIDVRMKTVPKDGGDMQFSSGNGSVSVALPAAFNGEIDASTGHGDFVSDFEIRIIGRLNPRRVRGTIGTGQGITIRMTTGNGPLELRKS